MADSEQGQRMSVRSVVVSGWLFAGTAVVSLGLAIGFGVGSDSPRRWIGVGTCGAASLMMLGLAIWWLRDPERVAARYGRQGEARQRSMRRHPLPWLLGIPIVGAVTAAIRINSVHHHSTTVTVIAAGIGGLCAAAAVAFALRRARRDSSESQPGAIGQRS
jgi:hypothetical protein